MEASARPVVQWRGRGSPLYANLYWPLCAQKRCVYLSLVRSEAAEENSFWCPSLSPGSLLRRRRRSKTSGEQSAKQRLTTPAALFDQSVRTAGHNLNKQVQWRPIFGLPCQRWTPRHRNHQKREKKCVYWSKKRERPIDEQ